MTSSHKRRSSGFCGWRNVKSVEIIDAARAREHVIAGGSRVHGYLPDTHGKGTVYQFHGCFFHGCERCYPDNRDVILKNYSSFNQRFENTQNMSNKIRSLGYKLIEKWECEFNNDLENNINIFNYLKEHPLAQNLTLNPRDAFYGGRRGNIVTDYEAGDDEVIRYFDVCCLYPFICKTGIFSVGHPEIYVGEQCLILTGQNFVDLKKNA